MNNIQWYPGHMTKTRRMMEENISLVDIVIELVDARIPYSSKNPDLDTIAKNKHRIVLLNKCDLADDKATAIWQEYFENQGFRVIRINALKGNGFGEITDTARDLMKEKIEKELNDSTAGFLRTKLAGKIELRHIPKIRFKYDESIAYGNNIDNLLLFSL